LESGPVLGLLFLLWRISLTLWLGWMAVTRALNGNTLPFLLYGACSLAILNGQWGQATTQGFTMFISGLCLASMRVPMVKRRSRVHSFSPSRFSASAAPVASALRPEVARPEGARSTVPVS
jgi:hypothetical protein